MNQNDLQTAGFRRKGKTFHRQINDLVQIINFQKSAFSDEQYVNVAIWPLALGAPRSLSEHVFPIKGRIEDFISIPPHHTEPLEVLIDALNTRFSSLEALRLARRVGDLANILFTKEANQLTLAKE